MADDNQETKQRAAFDMLMAKHLIGYSVEEFRVNLPRQLKDYEKEDLGKIGIRFAIPTGPDKKHFVVRTFDGQCYRVRHEGQSLHMYSVHVFRNANDDTYAVEILERSEVAEQLSREQSLTFA